MLLEINGKSVKNFASQGQQRSVALALKLSQLEYVKNETLSTDIIFDDNISLDLTLNDYQVGINISKN